MKKLFLFTMFIIFMGLEFSFCNITIAANSQSRGENYEYATVDTAPGASGYATETVNARKVRKKSQFREIWFSIGGSGTMTVTLQFLRVDVDGSTWNDYASYTSSEYKQLLEGAVNISWRAIVKQGNHTSGQKIFGFAW